MRLPLITTLDSTVPFGAELFRVITPLLVDPLRLSRPELPDQPEEPELPADPDEPSIPVAPYKIKSHFWSVLFPK